MLKFTTIIFHLSVSAAALTVTVWLAFGIVAGL